MIEARVLTTENERASVDAKAKSIDDMYGKVVGEVVVLTEVCMVFCGATIMAVFLNCCCTCII